MRYPLQALILVLGMATSAHAGLIRVPQDSPDIAGAAVVAASGDTIEVAAGNYAAWDIVLASGVTVRGATGNPADVVIDLQTHAALFSVAAPLCNLNLEAMTIANGGGALGAIVLDGGFGGTCNLDVTNCRFTACTSTGSGGAIQVVGRSEAPVNLGLTLTDCVFSGCSADAGGAAVAVVNGQLLDVTMTGVTAEGCAGGAFKFIAHDVGGVVTNCVFRNNSGGVLDLGSYYSRPFAVTTSVFEGNSRPSGQGAALLVSNGLSVALTQSEFVANQASSHGGAVSIWNAAQCVVANCGFRDNISGGRGGAIQALQCPILDFTSSTFSGNQAVRGGGVFGPNISLEAVDFLENSAFEGGALFCESANGGQVTMSGNVATRGGGLFLNGVLARSSLSHWLATGNTAGTGAAILASTEMIIDLNCCEIDLAECAGGPFAMQIPGYSELHVTSNGCVTPTESTSWGELKASFR